MNDDEPKDARRPLPPDVLADALQDRIAPTSGRLLSARPIAAETPSEAEARARLWGAVNEWTGQESGSIEKAMDAYRAAVLREADTLRKGEPDMGRHEKAEAETVALVERLRKAVEAADALADAAVASGYDCALCGGRYRDGETHAESCEVRHYRAARGAK